MEHDQHTELDIMTHQDWITFSNQAAQDAKAFARSIATSGITTSGSGDGQFLRHGLAWITTYAEALMQVSDLIIRLNEEQKCSTLEEDLTHILFGEYLNQLASGVAMSQSEIIRPQDLGQDSALAFASEASQYFMRNGNTAERRLRVAQTLAAQGDAPSGESGLDETHKLIRDQFRRFAEDKIVPHAHGWHVRDELIPFETISEMADLGVFGLTIPESYGGLGLGKEAMCVVSEELSRGYIGVGSLGTRTDIAAELIMQNGTEEQKKKYLPAIASGSILPTAVFTEPNIGSDLAHLSTRAKKTENGYDVFGNKTWITHAARADLMTLLVRTNPAHDDHRGLSMLLAEKPRGTDEHPFPAEGMSGGEITVLGYRGMKEYDISFDGFKVSEDALLGGNEGVGFKQLMQTFESARIQTAARAIGVAQSALELGLRYATERIQFGQPIFNFERVHSKIALMAAEIFGIRQLTYYAARQKDSGKRCDLEAGMAKLLAARTAWSCADNAVQIHGGNGFAIEYPISRVLCDARILSIFEGAAEIQADVIARRLNELYQEAP